MFKVATVSNDGGAASTFHRLAWQFIHVSSLERRIIVIRWANGRQWTWGPDAIHFSYNKSVAGTVLLNIHGTSTATGTTIHANKLGTMAAAMNALVALNMDPSNLRVRNPEWGGTNVITTVLVPVAGLNSKLAGTPAGHVLNWVVGSGHELYPAGMVRIEHGGGLHTLPGSGFGAVVSMLSTLETIGQHGNVVSGTPGADVMNAWLDAAVRQEIQGRKHAHLAGGLDSYGAIVRVPGSLPGTGVHAYVGLVPHHPAGKGSNVYCHLVGTYGVDVPPKGRGTFLMRFESMHVVSPTMVDAIVKHVANGHWLRQTNNAATRNRVSFQFSATGGTTWLTHASP